MQPDRSNYEIWLLDWLDGTLTGQEAEQFRIFLDKNPDLKEESEFMSFSYLSPGSRSFSGKSFLKKTASDLSASQVEYLSIAYLENDLSPDQLADLKQKIDENSDSRALFDSVQKTRLVPLNYKFRYKYLLKKYSTGAGIKRLSVIGLSLAATIALFILSYFFVPGLLPGSKDRSALVSTAPVEPFVVKTRIFTAPSEKIASADAGSEAGIGISAAEDTEEVFPELNNRPLLTVLTDTSEVKRMMPEFRIRSMPAFNVDLKMEPMKNSLIASIIEAKEPLDYDGRSRFSRFIARTFRDKILKDETGSDTPVKPFEIATAGIEGLNKLFGWEMALVKINDEDGDLKSIYFSSRILKFNAPVKKTETSR
jgi:hypothetical protein